MNIIIKTGGAVFAVRLNSTDFRAVRDILVAATLAFHPSSEPALAELKRAVAAQVSTWSSPLGGHEGRLADKPSEVGKVR